jgi:hypothetical protein
MRDLPNLVKKRAVNTGYRLFLDALSMLHSMDSGCVTFDTAWSTGHVVSKAAYKNTAQARVATLYQTLYQDIFDIADDTGTGFGKAMSSYAKRRDSSTGGGIVHSIRHGVRLQVAHITLSINNVFTDCEVQDLAREMLDKSKELIIDLCHFVKDFYTEMTESSAMSPEEASLLTTNLIFKIFREFSAARLAVKQVKETEPLLHLWGTLKTHEIMEQIAVNQFRDNPALKDILVRHIIKRNNNVDGTDQITKKIALPEGKVATAHVKARKKVGKDYVVREIAIK